MELRFNVDDHLIERLQERTDPNVRGADLAQNALIMLDWATSQAQAGRDIGSFDASGNHPRTWDCLPIAQARGHREV